jgi:tetratricopeptide (TPR) repeat protein
LMNVLGRPKEAREYINRALVLNPHSHIMYNLSAGYYYNEGAYEKAIEECKKSIEISQFGWPMHNLFVSNVRLGNDQEALENLKGIVSEDPSFDSSDMIDNIFLDSGIEGIIERYIRWLKENGSLDLYNRVNLNTTIARLFGLAGDSRHALESLEKAFEAGESGLPYINENSDLAILRDDPRFKAMLNELGL